MFVRWLFAKAENWKLSNIHEKYNINCVNNHTMEYNTAMKMNKLYTHTHTLNGWVPQIKNVDWKISDI